MSHFTDEDLVEITHLGASRLVVGALARELLAYRRGEVPLTDADRNARIRTLDGWLHPLAPRPGEITIGSVARGLATQIRYKGQTKKPYTVAEHSVLVSLLVAPEYAREGLLHDANEAFLGDMAAPMKRTPSMAGFRRIEDILQAAVYQTFGVRPTPDSTAAVHDVDQRMCSDEMPQLIVNPTPEHMAEVRARCGPPHGVHIPCYGLAQAENLFLARFATLFPEFAT